ncbi:MAG TPA: hypothetical protein DEO84_08110 [candidate division Zixibacteria bacterium]|nr:hypothetical protein [candidate division Zixibacteria bacterium]
MPRSILLALVLMAIFAVQATAIVIHVPAQYSLISEGVDASSTGDTILVAPGDYTLYIRIDFGGKNILLKSESGPEVTTLRGPYTNWPIIKLWHGESPRATVEGFTITGGGLAVEIANASATIINNVFTRTGAISANGGDSLYILNNIFRSNSSGAVVNYSMKLVCRDNQFIGNMAQDGGAIRILGGSNSVIDHNLFVGNNCLWRGAAVSFVNCAGGLFFNNTMVANSDSGFNQAAALTLDISQNVLVYNNIIAANFGRGIWNFYSSDCIVTYNDVWGNSTNYYDMSPGIGSISVDPLFWGGSPYLYNISFDSPCRNAGDPNSPLDPDASRADMGNYYDYRPSAGHLIGQVYDASMNPLPGTVVSALYTVYQDTTDELGKFMLRNLPAGSTYNLLFQHLGQVETTLTDITVVPDDTTDLGLVQLLRSSYGSIAGTVRDSLAIPLPGAFVSIFGTPYLDTTDEAGYYLVYNIIGGRTYNLKFSHDAFVETTCANVPIVPGDTTILDVSLRAHHTLIHVPVEYSTIQAAIYASIDGDTVLVERGIYQEPRLNLNGRRILLASQYLFTQDTTDIWQTTITGPGDHTDTLVVLDHSEVFLTQVIGFHIKGGYWGIFVNGASPQILNNIIEDNHSNTRGAGIYWHGGHITIRGNWIINNVANMGGAIGISNGQGTIDHNIIAGNLAAITPGIYMDGVNTINIFNNTFYNNHNTDPGPNGVIFVDVNANGDNYTSNVYNNIIASNDFGINYQAPNSTLNLDHNDFYDNIYGICDLCTPGPTNIQADPEFVGGDPFDFHLFVSSPCIDAGRPGIFDPDNSPSDLGALWPPSASFGYIAGTVLDTLNIPIANVSVSVLNHSRHATTNINGDFICGPLALNITYELLFHKYGYFDSTRTEIAVTDHDTTFLGNIFLLNDPRASDTLYVTADFNGNGDATALADIIYGANAFFGGPPVDSSFCIDHYWQAAGDLNGNCIANGIDFNLAINYWKGTANLQYCPTCPHPQPDPFLPPLGIDPGAPDSIIIGNLNGTPYIATPGDTLLIPIWAKTDEAIAGVNLSIAADTAYISQWLGVDLNNPISGWASHEVTQPSMNRPLPGYSTETILDWRLTSTDGSYLNTNGTYIQIAAFTVILGHRMSIFGDTAQVIGGEHVRSGTTAFCDTTGTNEWAPTIVSGKIFFHNDSPYISLSRTAIDDTLLIDESVSDTLLISNYGQTALHYTIANDSFWVTVNPLSGDAQSDESDTIVVTLNSQTLEPGLYYGPILITSNDPRRSSLILPSSLLVRRPGCSYVIGDANGSNSFTGLDVTYSVRYFKGGNPPPFLCECTSGNFWYVSGDVNGSCSFTGLDITYMVRYFKGGPGPIACPDCPPARLLAPPNPDIER